MDCTPFRDLLSDELDGRLADGDAARLDDVELVQHLLGRERPVAGAGQHRQHAAVGRQVDLDGRGHTEPQPVVVRSAWPARPAPPDPLANRLAWHPVLAGVTLVFPITMLMQMMSAGAMGGGISSSIARALGAGRRDDANALAVHALLIALAEPT